MRGHLQISSLPLLDSLPTGVQGVLRAHLNVRHVRAEVVLPEDTGGLRRHCGAEGVDNLRHRVVGVRDGLGQIHHLGIEPRNQLEHPPVVNRLHGTFPLASWNATTLSDAQTGREARGARMRPTLRASPRRIRPDAANGLAHPSSAQCQYLRSVVTERLVERRGHVGPVILGEIRETLSVLMDL